MGKCHAFLCLSPPPPPPPPHPGSRLCRFQRVFLAVVVIEGRLCFPFIAVFQVVTRECHGRVFGDTVQASAPPACLDNCGPQKTNTSSPCWTDCFYKAALGPNAGRANGTVAGMPIAAMVKAWEKPFLPEAHGGCPPVQTVHAASIHPLQ